ncbi:MAG: OmpA family protein [Chitinophagaceae bacterium]
MASRKYKMILALAGLISTASFAQRNDAGYNGTLDSSKVSTKMMPQQNEFMSNQYPYPAKPRSMWELGFGGGLSQIYGDVYQKLGYGGSVSFRKALGHSFSLRAGYTGGITYGTDFYRRTSYSVQDAGAPNPWKAYTASNTPFSTNYRAKIHQISLDMLFSLNALNLYRGNPKMDFYLLAGYGAMGADVDVNAKMEANAPGNRLYSFANIDYSQKSTDIQKQIKDMEDDTYESNAPVQRRNRNGIGRQDNNWIIVHTLNAGGGMAWKLSDRVNIGIEQRFSFGSNDDLDGIYGGAAKDVWSNTQARLNINIGNSATHVQPLWWLNGLNYAYNELNAPKHMKMPPVVLPDADGDGVTDQFDMEPNTPSGCPVDSHGVSKDTDGDGVPDCRDKEILTLQSCFPVDADGVGKCPPPECCKTLAASPASCTLSALPSVQFKSGSVTLSASAQSILNSVAQQMMANPSCNVSVMGHGASDKRAQQLSWDRVNAVIKYLTEKQGISEGRLIFGGYGTAGDSNTVDMMGTSQTGPNMLPAPHPQFQKTN